MPGPLFSDPLKGESILIPQLTTPIKHWEAVKSQTGEQQIDKQRHGWVGLQSLSTNQLWASLLLFLTTFIMKVISSWSEDGRFRAV